MKHPAKTTLQNGTASPAFTAYQHAARLCRTGQTQMAPCITVDGAPLRTAAQVRRMLKEARAEGLEFIPAAGCDNYDSKGLCKGHTREEIVDEQAGNG